MRSTPQISHLARAAALASALVLPLATSAATAKSGAMSQEVRFALPASEATASELADFYRGRGHRPLWIDRGRLRPEAHLALAMIASARADGLDPEDYDLPGLASRIAAASGGEAAALARAELALSSSLAAFLADLHTPPPEARVAFTDPALAPPPATRQEILETAARAPTLRAFLDEAKRMNPLYAELREALAAHRAGREPAASADDTERLILANMARLRGLPADLGRRFVLVDAAAARLWLYEDGRVRDTMRVAVGRANAPTPMMAGMIRYAQFNPYWNLPETMVRDEIAPRVLREGTGFLAAQGMEALSGWSKSARLLDLDEVDWAAVAAGERGLRLRQRPGPGNILGRVKLMLPNALGIYLHDTADKSVFAAPRRTVSAGCIRLEDAPRLVRRLLGPAGEGPPPQALDARVDLPEPVPVYILYLTAAAEQGRLARRPDIYARDAPLLARLENAD